MPFCSGSLIAPDVFLTAAHCIVGAEQIAEEEEVEPSYFVSFDSELGEFPEGDFDIHEFDLAAGVTLLPGEPFFDERFGTGGASRPFDIAVIVLDASGFRNRSRWNCRRRASCLSYGRNMSSGVNGSRPSDTDL